MSRSGHRVIRAAHLRIASPPRPSAPAPSRASLLLAALLVRVQLALLTLLAIAGAIVALAPVLLRRAPVGRRVREPRRAARVIPFHERRQQASSRA